MRGGDIAAVEAAVRSRSRALVAGDVTAMERLLAEGFVYTNAGGHVAAKRDYVDAFVASPDVRWERQDISELEIALYGNAAIATCRVHDVASYGGERLDDRFRSTLVFVRQDGVWRCAAGHTSRAPETA
jgi:uncharacterized protein (TIGR02246 family)